MAKRELRLGWPECDLCKRWAKHTRARWEGKLFSYQFVCDSHKFDYPSGDETEPEQFSRWMDLGEKRAMFLRGEKRKIVGRIR